MHHSISLDSTFGLLLDRDGVLNRRLSGRYVTTPDELEILPGVGEALATLARWVGPMVVVTNQQGIGKGLMTGADLARVHDALIAKLGEHGVTLAGIHHCPHLDEDRCRCRKPAPGLVEAAARDHPGLDPRRSVMVGDSAADVALGHAVGAVTVFVRNADDDRDPPPDPHLTVTSLAELARRVAAAAGELRLDRAWEPRT